MLPRSAPIEPEAVDLADFLRANVEAIARQAARTVTVELSIAGTGTRRRLRKLFEDQLLELARQLASFGREAPRLYGESQRRHAAARLAQGASLAEALDERALLHEAIVVVWGEERGPMPAEHVRLLSETLAATASQAAQVYLTYQRAESVAFQEAALLDTIVHHLDEAIMVLEADGSVSYATPALEQVLGLPPRLIVGVHPERMAALVEKLDVRDPSGAKVPLRELPQQVALRTRKPSHAPALGFRRLDDGRPAMMELYAAPVFDEDGELRGVVLTLRDVTKSYTQTRELETAYEDLRQMHARLLSRSRFEATGELAGSTAHALNNQLNIIALRLRRLQELPGAEEEAAAISRSVKEIAELVRRLQEFAAAPGQEAPRAVDVPQTVRAGVELVRAEVAQGGRRLELRLEDVPPALAEREALLEFLVALVLGARDVTPRGEPIVVTCGREDGRIVLRVIDRGPALTPRQLESLFAPLGPDAGERSLSLAVGRQAVTRWGGEVRVIPQEPAGNVYELRLPLAAEERGAAPAAAPPHAAKRGVERVLVVDDDPDNAAMLADLLVGTGAAAFVAKTGREAIARAERERPQAALVDLLLPDMSGWDVVRELRRLIPELRIAVVSGLAPSRDEQERGGADAVFRKPVDTDGILDFLGLEGS